MGGMEVDIDEFLTSALYGHEWCASYWAVLYLGKQPTLSGGEGGLASESVCTWLWRRAYFCLPVV